MLRGVLRFLFGGAGSPAATPRTAVAASSRAVIPGTPAHAAAQKAMVTAILELRAIVDRGSAEQIAVAIDAFKAKATAGDLEPRELAGEVAKGERMLTVLAYLDRLNRGEGLQAMATMPDGEPAYFRATNVSRETARDDDHWGRLDIGEKGIFYDGLKRVTIVWSKVLTIGADDKSLIVHPTRGGTPHTFGLHTLREAHLAQTVASAIFKQQVAPAGLAPTQRKRRSPKQAPRVTPDDSRLAAFDLGSAASACNFNIVGESHYQGRLRNICTAGRAFTVELRPEPTNAFDPNAIRVVAVDADTVGYLSREDAIHYAPVFQLLAQHNRVGTCRARLTGGAGEKRTFGVLLNLREVDELLPFIRDTLNPGATAVTDQPF